MMNLLKCTIIGAALIALAGCGTIANQIGGKPLARSIDDDAVELNNSHVRAINGVITVNALRARDRWPTGYTTLSGVRFNPTRQLQGGLNFNQGLVGGSTPPTSRVTTSASATGTLTANAQYSVNPFAEQDTSQSLYSAEGSEEIFRRYLEAAWPRRVVFALFVDHVRKGGEICHINGDDLLAKAVNGIDYKGEFATKYEDQPSHPCRIIKEAFASNEEIDWSYDLNSNYWCHNGICTRISESRRNNYRRGISAKPEFLESNPCVSIEKDQSSTLILSKSEEGLSAKLTAVASSAGRDIVTTAKDLRLCDRLSTGRTFYKRIPALEIKESYPQAIKRLFRSYQDRALASFLLRSKYKSGKVIQDKFKIVEKSDIDKCIAVLKKIGVTKAYSSPSDSDMCTEDVPHFEELLENFIGRNTYEQPVGTIHFRSFDDMVYFVGETLRLPTGKKKGLQPDALSNYGLCVSWSADKLCDGRLFRVLQRGELTALAEGVRTGFGVEVKHAGHNWRALPEVSPKNIDKSPDKEIDNTGLVLSILSQLYLLNQSSEFLEAPENILLQ